VDPHLTRLQQEIAAAISGCDAEQLAWHPPGKWCTAEILEHLYLTYTGTTKGCARVLDAGKPLASASSLKHNARSLLVVGLGYMPGGRESPASARPRGLAAEKVAVEIVSKINEMDAILEQCASKFGSRSKVLDHPVLGPFSIQQWRKFHLVHGHHHVKQIRRLREQMGPGEKRSQH
jgi:DinB superfamily